jgi:hypothetical protein
VQSSAHPRVSESGKQPAKNYSSAAVKPELSSVIFITPRAPSRRDVTDQSAFTPRVL